MLAYHFNPNIVETSTLKFNKQMHVASNKIVTLNFLADAGEGVHQF